MFALDNTDVAEETVKNVDMGSLNHSILQGRLAVALGQDERFTLAVELSLDISQVNVEQFDIKAKGELKPDICLYPNQVGLSYPRDIFKMVQMPLLAIEILSPKQGMDDILVKFQIYFELGVQSCWLVTPTLKEIAIYSSLIDFDVFNVKDKNELVDQLFDIRLSLRKIFK